ncbi:MAG: hypothetical protein ACLQVD_02375 [Capsulimonadaceae bacterium]
MTLQPAGRVLVLRWSTAVNGDAPAPDEIARVAATNSARFVVVDTTSAPYTDTNGIRWLMRLRELPMNFRIAVRPNGRISRALKLVQFEGATVDTARRAWSEPWRARTSA